MKVIDMSHHNNDTLFNEILNDPNIGCVILKSTEGIGYVDPTYSTRQRKVVESGKILGVYHYARFEIDTNTPHAEALNLSCALGESSCIPNFIVLDVEGKCREVTNLFDKVVEFWKEIQRMPRTRDIPMLLYCDLETLKCVYDTCPDPLKSEISKRLPYLWIARYDNREVFYTQEIVDKIARSGMFMNDIVGKQYKSEPYDTSYFLDDFMSIIDHDNDTPSLNDNNDTPSLNDDKKNSNIGKYTVLVDMLLELREVFNKYIVEFSTESEE